MRIVLACRLNLAILIVILQFHYYVDSLYLPDTPSCISTSRLINFSAWRRLATPNAESDILPGSGLLLSGVPDLWDRNKILSGGDLSHYQLPHCIRFFFFFVCSVFIHHNFQFYFALCTYPYPEPVYTGTSSVHWNVTGMPLVDPVYTGIPLGDQTNTCMLHWNTTGKT